MPGFVKLQRMSNRVG